MREATLTAVDLIGNVNTRISPLRREKVINDLNKSLTTLVKEDDHFREAPPNFFGPDFAKQSKEFMDQLQAMRPQKKASKQPLFLKRSPSSRGGVKDQPGAATGEGNSPTTEAGVATTPQENKRTDRKHPYTCSHTVTHSFANNSSCSLYDQIFKRKGHSTPICIRSTSWMATVFSEKLGSPNKAQVDPRNSKGLQDKI